LPKQEKQSLIDLLTENLKPALKEHRAEEVLVLRGLIAAIHNEHIKIGKDKELPEDKILQTIGYEAKKRREALAIYEKAGRKDLADKEASELKIIEKYLPKQLSDEELTIIVKKAIEKSGASGVQDMGKVMGMVMGEVKGKADGMKVKEIVEKELTPKA